jgi:carbohydrate-binding DOMON domain-containing protein
MLKPKDIVQVTKQLGRKEYWNMTNTIEFWAFSTKLMIIFPGLILGIQFWWLYIFALVSSLALILTSTVKTLPTIIYFNVGWTILASAAIAKHFGLIL